MRFHRVMKGTTASNFWTGNEKYRAFPEFNNLTGFLFLSYDFLYSGGFTTAVEMQNDDFILLSVPIYFTWIPVMPPLWPSKTSILSKVSMLQMDNVESSDPVNKISASKSTAATMSSLFYEVQKIGSIRSCFIIPGLVRPPNSEIQNSEIDKLDLT